MAGGLAAAGVAAGWWAAIPREEPERRNGVSSVPEPLRAAPAEAPVVARAPEEGISPGAAEAGWTDVLAATRMEEHAVSGGWTRRGAEVASDGGICKLRLPVEAARLAATGYRYDIEVEFTRLSGRNSVGVFLPTSSGTGVFELDAWDAGLGGLQMINGQDMRAHGENFPAALRNGERQTVRIEVRGARVAVSWNGVPRRSWDLTGKRVDATGLWEVGEWMGPGLCSWKSPTVFHRAAWQAAGAGN